MSVCYIINEPLRFDGHSGKLIPMYDLTSAESFGRLVYVLPRGNNPPKDPELTLPLIKDAMRHYTKEDYIIAVGHIELFSWATALAVQATDGIINQLKWDNSIEQYVPRRARLW